jgi:hypothetical protein
MTHKNPALRASSVVPDKVSAAAGAPAPAAKVAAKKPVQIPLNTTPPPTLSPSPPRPIPSSSCVPFITLPPSLLSFFTTFLPR